MHDEYRITVEVADLGRDDDLVAELERSLPHTDVSTVSAEDEGTATVYAYADREADAAWAFERLPVLLDDAGATILDTRFERWNPGEGAWQHPSLPVSPAPPELLPLIAELDTARWEVRVHSPSGDDLRRVREELEEDDVLCLTTGWRRFAALTEDAGEAAELVDRIRLALPIGSSVEAHPLSRHRRWFLHEMAGENYGPGAGGP